MGRQQYPPYGPAGWPHQTIWQFADKGTLPGDQNYFNGERDRLQALTQG